MSCGSVAGDSPDPDSWDSTDGGNSHLSLARCLSGCATENSNYHGRDQSKDGYHTCLLLVHVDKLSRLKIWTGDANKIYRE